MEEWLKAVGLTLPQMAAFALTVIAAYFSARFGASESRRQYAEKAETERRQVATELTHSLMVFALACEHCCDDVLPDSKIPAKQQLEAVRKIQLPDDCPRKAAALGGEIAAQVVRIQVIKTRIDRYLSRDFKIGSSCMNEEEDGETLSSWVSLLEYRARQTADLSAKVAGMALAHSKLELEALLHGAKPHMAGIDSPDGQW